MLKRFALVLLAVFTVIAVCHGAKPKKRSHMDKNMSARQKKIVNSPLEKNRLASHFSLSSACISCCGVMATPHFIRYSKGSPNRVGRFRMRPKPKHTQSNGFLATVTRKRTLLCKNSGNPGSNAQPPHSIMPKA